MFTGERISFEISWFNSYCSMHQSSADGGARLNCHISWLHHVGVSDQLMIEKGSSWPEWRWSLWRKQSYADDAKTLPSDQLTLMCTLDQWWLREDLILWSADPLISWSYDQLIAAPLMPLQNIDQLMAMPCLQARWCTLSRCTLMPIMMKALRWKGCRWYLYKWKLRRAVV